MKKNYLNTDLTIASDGNYVHVTESGRENFKKWFKESKVKNLNGSPQIMYHGTYQSFDMFDKNKIGSRFSADNEGFFAISCPKIASDYAEYEEGFLNSSPNVMPLFVSIQNPLIVNHKFLASEGMAPIGVRDCVIDFWDNYQDLILTWADERKSDGILLIDESRLKSKDIIMMSVAFKANQLKSAIGNSGSFDLKSSSLTDSKDLNFKVTNKLKTDLENNTVRKKLRM